MTVVILRPHRKGQRIRAIWFDLITSTFLVAFLCFLPPRCEAFNVWISNNRHSLHHAMLSDSSSRASLRWESDSLAESEKQEEHQYAVEMPGQHTRRSDSDIVTYKINLEIARLANSGRNSTAAALAHELLLGMEYPDTVAYNSVLKAYAKCSPYTLHSGETAASIALGLLEEMKNIHYRQRKSNEDWYDRNAEGLLLEEELLSGPPRIRVKPNVRSFSTVMDAWGRAGDAERVLELLQELKQRYEDTQDGALKPNTISYNTVLSAYAKSGLGKLGAEKCQCLLKDMPVTPDVISYNAVLNAWARSRVLDAGEQAEQILRQMPIPPNSRSYSSVMNAWSRSGSLDAAKRAHALLEEMECIYQETGNNSMKPTCFSYSIVINAYALSKEPRKAEIAFQLLQQMRNRSTDDPTLKPNSITYNSVLNACATSSPHYYKGDGLEKMVRKLYYQILKEGQPDHFTFGTVLKACASLLWDDHKFCEEVFHEACERGQVSFGVLYQLRQAAPLQLYRALLPSKAYQEENGHFILKETPQSWRRHVHEGQKNRKRGKQRWR